MTTAVAADKSGTITFDVNLNTTKDAKQASLWIPYPVSDDRQTISDVKITGNCDVKGIYRDPESSVLYLHANWARLTTKPSLKMSFHVTLKNLPKETIADTGAPIPVEIRKYLEPCEFVPSNDFKGEAAKATKGKTTVSDKARAVYDWVVENTHRDPTVKGCGLAIPSRTLTERKGGGKCADISAVFVTMARAAGIPSRDVYGLRLANPKSGDVTSGFHCWAEIYLPGTGWFSVDPADVRKMMLVHKLELKDAADWRSFFWGRDDLFRVVLAKDARGVTFNPKQADKALNYFMYPYAEVDGKALNHFDPKAFGYSVSFKKGESK
jgi:hypothetical protein